jgi:hypothetical protein
MRVGVSGTHGTGKTTLVEDLCAHLAGHVPADEPYYLLEEEGYEFEFPPSLDDNRAQLRRSLLPMSTASHAAADHLGEALLGVQDGRDVFNHLGEDGLWCGEVEPECACAACAEGGSVHDRDVRAVDDEFAG